MLETSSMLLLTIAVARLVSPESDHRTVIKKNRTGNANVSRHDQLPFFQTQKTLSVVCARNKA